MLATIAQALISDLRAASGAFAPGGSPNVSIATYALWAGPPQLGISDATYAFVAGPQQPGVAESWPLAFYFVVSYVGILLVASGIVAAAQAGPGLVRRYL
jgi:hypothetical protein